MDYRRDSQHARQQNAQQPHTPRQSAQPARPLPRGARPTARPALPPGMGQPAPGTVPLRPGQRLPTHGPINSGAPVAHPAYDYTTPVMLDAVAVDMSIAELDTEYQRTPQEIVALCKSWLRRPTFDIEYMPGCEAHAGKLAAWHDAQLARKAKVLGCSMRMIVLLEILVGCFIDERQPPEGAPLARRLLLEY